MVRTIGHDETNPVTLTLISTFWMDLYKYAWFVSFGIAFAVYAVAMKARASHGEPAP